jgi:thymidylate kinase
MTVPARSIANRIGLFSRRRAARTETRPVGWLRRSAADLSLRVGQRRSIANLRRHGVLDVLILDRCYADEIIRAVYKFGHGTELGLRLLGHVPAPTLAFSFSVAAETGYERKKTREMSLAEYEKKARVTRDILAAAGRSWNLVSIHVDGLTPDDVFDRVWAHVREHLAAVE